jgi:hypothetical protein
MKVQSIVVVIAFLVFGLSIACIESSAFSLDESVTIIAAGTDYENVAPQEDFMDEGDEEYSIPEQEEDMEWDQEDIAPGEDADSEDNFENVAPQEDLDYENY